tara:strand:- start:4868 stop:5374 length:507 start_codon:yes stop_codon:yes gene_type:complete
MTKDRGGIINTPDVDQDFMAKAMLLPVTEGMSLYAAYNFNLRCVDDCPSERAKLFVKGASFNEPGRLFYSQSGLTPDAFKGLFFNAVGALIQGNRIANIQSVRDDAIVFEMDPSCEIVLKKKFTDNERVMLERYDSVKDRAQKVRFRLSNYDEHKERDYVVGKPFLDA